MSTGIVKQYFLGKVYRLFAILGKTLRIRRIAPIVVLCLCALFLSLSCRSQTPPELEALPALQWSSVELSNFVPREKWEGRRVDWEQVNKGLRFDLQIPQALETKLHKTERENWKMALDAFERYQVVQKDARMMAKFAFIPLDECELNSVLFSVNQRAQLQILLQQHRNVLWRLGRLALAQRYVFTSIEELRSLFVNDRIKGSDILMNKGLASIEQELKNVQTPFAVPNGIWRPGELHSRIARQVNAAPIILRADFALKNWTERCEKSERWHYLAHSSGQTLDALERWLTEYRSLLPALRDYANQAQTTEDAFARNPITETPCITQSMRRTRILSALYVKLFSLQWELLQAQVYAEFVLEALTQSEYEDSTPEFLQSEVQNFLDSLESQKIRLTQAEDLVLVVWDQSNHVFWQALPDFIDPITHPTRAACEDTKAWQAIFAEVKQNAISAAKVRNAEAPAETNRRGKVQTPYVSQVREFMHSPTRIDEVEKGLLAISELESHMSAIRDELLRLCKEGACKSFPEAQLSRSLRNAPWVRLWQQSPIADRQASLTFLVLKRSALYLNRLVQRFTEIYAWFAETSNADITWPKLKAWQRTWTLYAELDGSYASFLRAVAGLDQSLFAFSKAPPRQSVSPELLQLLKIQHQLFNIVIDYARFADIATAPANFDDVVDCWEHIDKAILEIEAKTLEQMNKEKAEL
jgi:hypothetical protein